MDRLTEEIIVLKLVYNNGCEQVYVNVTDFHIFMYYDIGEFVITFNIRKEDGKVYRVRKNSCLLKGYCISKKGIFNHGKD